MNTAINTIGVHRRRQVKVRREGHFSQVNLGKCHVIHFNNNYTLTIVQPTLHIISNCIPQIFG